MADFKAPWIALDQAPCFRFPGFFNRTERVTGLGVGIMNPRRPLARLSCLETPPDRMIRA
jgi:hypothetical protein